MVREVECSDCEGKGWFLVGIPYMAYDGEVDVDTEKEPCSRCGGAGMIIADDKHCAPIGRGHSNEI